MINKSLEILPSVTVHDLLEAYPQLEDVLISIASPFKKLENPMVRKNMARIATIKHISSVGGVPLNELISKLRETVGQAPLNEAYIDEEYFGEMPEWFASDKVVLSVNDSTLKDKNEMTVVTLLKKSKKVKPGEIIELITTFLPAPGIDTMKSKGYSVWVKQETAGIIKTYFLKPDFL